MIMAIGNVSSRTVGVGGALALAFGLLASGGMWYIHSQRWGLIFEIAYLLILLIALAIVGDRAFVR